MITAREFFIASEEERRKFRLATEKYKCKSCDGDGVCASCEGEGEIEHDCNCEYCGWDKWEDCEYCDKTGKCKPCNGEGVRFLNQAELIQAGFGKSEAQQAIAMRVKQ